MELNIQSPNQILNTAHFIITTATQKFYKNGIELEKGGKCENVLSDELKELLLSNIMGI